MLSDNGSENTTHWNIFWTLTHVTIVITIMVVIVVAVAEAIAAATITAVAATYCRFHTLRNALQSGNVHVFCAFVCMCMRINILLSTALILSFLYLCDADIFEHSTVFTTKSNRKL